jgi:hypothetical protein
MLKLIGPKRHKLFNNNLIFFNGIFLHIFNLEKWDSACSLQVEIRILLKSLRINIALAFKAIN